jgi:hypothetical protein
MTTATARLRGIVSGSGLPTMSRARGKPSSRYRNIPVCTPPANNRKTG